MFVASSVAYRGEIHIFCNSLLPFLDRNFVNFGQMSHFFNFGQRMQWRMELKRI